MNELINENGEMVLPGLEGPWEYHQPKGHGTGQTSSQTEDWFTHKDIVDRVHAMFGTIDLDPMSCEEANRVVQATTYYTAEMDGLTYPWYGRMLLNPPWGGTDASAVKRRAVKKLLDAFELNDVKECVCVMNSNALTTAWFAPLLKFPVCLPPRRIPHWGPDGAGGSPNSGTVIIYVGRDLSQFWRHFKDLGQIMVPVERIISDCT